MVFMKLVYELLIELNSGGYILACLFYILTLIFLSY